MEILLKILPLPVWLWLLGGLMFRGLVAWHLPTGFDEAYYYLYSRHLNWSYFDHPPIVALTTGIGWWITQAITPFTLRWGALLLYTVSLDDTNPVRYTSYRMGCRRDEKVKALWGATP